MKIDSRLTVTMDERLECPFVIWGEKTKIKVVDFDKLIPIIKGKRKTLGLSNIIQIIPAKSHQYFDPTYRPTFAKDPVTEIFYGIIVGDHPDGNPKWNKIPLGESLQLDINKDSDCRLWIVLRMHPEINISPFASANPKYIVVDQEIEAKNTLDRMAIISSLLVKVRTMKKEDLKMFARWCDIVLVGTETPNYIRAKLGELALNNPDFVQSKYEDSRKDIGQVYSSAKQLGLISYDGTKGYQFGDIFLGLTDYESLQTLDEHPEIVTAMTSKVGSMDKQVEKKMNQDE